VAKNLVIVESPAKAKTIKRYFGADFQVIPSVGHVVDLPKSKLGVDVEDDFKPEYHVIAGKVKVIEEYQGAAKGKPRTSISRPTRTAKARRSRGTSPSSSARSTPRSASGTAARDHARRGQRGRDRNPSELNQDLFDAQQARRVLDRLVGYKVSPAAVGQGQARHQRRARPVRGARIIVEREKEREAFRAEEYWTLDARLKRLRIRPRSRLGSTATKTIASTTRPTSCPRPRRARSSRPCEQSPFVVKSVERKEVRRSPTPPFITSRLQQEASRKLYFSALAHDEDRATLYEGIELGDQGAVGLITYMRTDSPRVSDQALASPCATISNALRQAITCPTSRISIAPASQAQDAHEAIRPTAVERDPESLARYLDKDELALYTLIYNRFVSSQMNPAVYDRTTVDIESADGALPRHRPGDEVRRLHAGLSRRPGRSADRRRRVATLPAMTEGERLTLVKPLLGIGFDPEQHFTQPPPRFTQATLIKELEEKGIGRPSTYAAIMTEYPEPRVRRRGREQADASDFARPRGLRPAGQGLPRHSRSGLHRPDRAGARRGRRGQGKLGQDPQALLRAVRKATWAKPKRRCPRSSARVSDRPQVRTRRRHDGHQMGPQRRIPRLLELPQVHQHQRVQARRSGQGHPAGSDLTRCHRRGLREMRQADGTPALALRRIPRLLRLSGLRRHQAHPRRTGHHRRRLPDCKEGEVLERRSRRGKIFYGCGRYPKCKFASWDRVVPHPCPDCGATYLVEKTTKRDGTRWQCPNKECGYQQPPADAPAPPVAHEPPAPTIA
jgi:DNA topoisomerase-1